MAVHKDKNHIHCHLVTNSVSYEDGRKLHNTKKDLECMKQLTNQMCRERGLTIAEKGKHFDGTGKLYQQRKVYRKNEAVRVERKLDRETEAHHIPESGWKESA